MRSLQLFILAWAAVLVSITAHSDEGISGLSSDPPPMVSSLVGYPGVLSREYVHYAVEHELRNQLHEKAAERRNNIYVREEWERDLQQNMKPGSTNNNVGDISGLNDVLQNFVFDIPQQKLQRNVLGVTATINVAGKCGSFYIGALGLDYKTGGNSLTYKVNVDNLAVKCQLQAEWNLGALDVSDKLTIRIVLDNNNFVLGVTLLGSPPTSSTFEGCTAQINVASISSSGGFSSNILNELSDLILEIVKNEASQISNIICQLLTGFSSTVDGILATLDETVAPYLGKVAKVNPLQLQNNVQVQVPLVDLTDSTLGRVLQVFITNLRGVIGAYQINKLIELNLLDKNGLYKINLASGRRLQQSSGSSQTCKLLRRNRNLQEAPEQKPGLQLGEEIIYRLKDTLDQELGLPLERHLRDSLRGRQMQLSTGGLFHVNNVTVQTVALAGLNTFKDSQFLEIIGKQTLQSQLALEGLSVVATLMLDADIAQTNIKETITASLSVDGISATVSLFAGLNAHVINGLTLSNFLNTSDIAPCLLSSVVAAGVSQLTVNAQSVGTPVVSGVLSSGVDVFLNRAVEAAFVTYQQLLLQAVPNIFQNNVTVILNDYLECYIRVHGPKGSCSETSLSQVVLGSSGSGSSSSTTTSGSSGTATQGSGSSVTFQFKDTTGGSTTQFDGTSAGSGPTSPSTASTSSSTPVPSPTFANVTEKSGSFISTDPSYFQSAAASESTGGFVKGFIDFRDLFLPPAVSQSLGGSGKQPYGDLISMAYAMMKDKMDSLDNTTGLPAINTDVIQPLTEEQSGVSGMFRFPETFFNTSIDTLAVNFLRSILKRIDISASDTRIGNLDTLVSPVKFLEPTDQAHVLQNVLNFGPIPGRPLNTTFGLHTYLEGVDSIIGWSNEVDISTSMADIDVSTDIRIMVATKEFLQFPINDILNINCWLALFQAPNMDISGGDTITNALAIKTFMMKIASTAINFKCRNCSSTLLPMAFDLLEQTGATETLGGRVANLLEEIITVDTVPAILTNFMKLGEEAARLCPHSATFNTTSEQNTTLSFDIPPLSYEAIDSIVYASILGAEVMAVAFAESHIGDSTEIEDPLSAQTTTSIPDETKLLDWTRLNETFIPFAGELLNFTRSYLSQKVDGSNGVAVNEILQGFLDDNGSIKINAGGMTFEFSGVGITVNSIQMTGLDSFTYFDVLQPVAPQILQNTVQLDHLSLMVDFSVNATTSDPLHSYSVSFDLENINATVYLYTAIDLEKLGSLEMGSLLFLKNLVPCFLSTAYDVHTTATSITVGNITNPTIHGLLSDTSEAASASMQAMFEKFGSEMSSTISSILDSAVRGSVNDFIASFRKGSSGCTNEFLASTTFGSTTLTFRSTASVLDSSKSLDDFIDFRDLLLAPEDSITLGGSGTQPYGDLVPTIFGMLNDRLVSTSQGELNKTNSIVDSITMSQSGVQGMLRFRQELFQFTTENFSVGFLDWLDEKLQFRLFDARIRNVNTLVSPFSILQPTHRPHVLENTLNFGPVAGSPLNATFGFLMALEGDLPLLDTYNELDMSTSFGEVNLFTDVSMIVAKNKLFRFPLKDIMELNCWSSMIQSSSPAGDIASPGFDMKSFLITLASLNVDARCRNCTSNAIPVLINLMEGTGVSETLAKRLAPFLEEIVTGNMVSGIVEQFVKFGNEAALLCPHSPLFNMTQTGPGVASQKVELPKLSDKSLDTILFSAVIAAQFGVVTMADNHLKGSQGQSNVDPFETTLNVPASAKILDWSDMNSTIPFIGTVLHFVRNVLGEKSVTETGSHDLGVNTFVRSIIGEDGNIDFPVGGVGVDLGGIRLSLHSVRVQGFDSFTRFDVLKSLSTTTLENTVNMNKLILGFNLSIDALETSEAPKEVSITFQLNDVNISMPILAVIDEGILGSMEIGSLLHASNILPCLMSASYGLRIQEMVVAAGRIAEPIIEGLLPDTSDAASSSFKAVLGRFGNTITKALPTIFNRTIRILLNGVLNSQDQKGCQDFSSSISRYVDFRDIFGTAGASTGNVYGDIIPTIRNMIQTGLLSNGADTGMPKINDVLIAPLTEKQSGVIGTLALRDKIFGFDYDGLAEIGIDTLGFAFSNARIENLNSVGPPLEIFEPNSTSGVLLDNRATFGTEISPLRFAIRNSVFLSGSLLNTTDEMEIFGELRGAPFLAVILARIGSDELLTFPLQYASDIHCWLATIAAPALQEIAQGKTQIDPILALHYLGVTFSTVRVSVSCFNCTTPGLIQLPELLGIMEASGTKAALGKRAIQLVMEILSSDFTQTWILKILQASMRKCPRTQNSTSSSLLIADADVPMISADWIETLLFAATVFGQLGTVVIAETISVVDSKLAPMFEEPDLDIPPGTRLVDFTELDTYPMGSLVKRFLDGANAFLGEPSTDPQTGKAALGINELLGQNPLMSLDTFSQQFDNLDLGISDLSIKLKEFKISGLDTFSKFNILNFTGPTRLQNELGWEKLEIELFLEIDTAASPKLQHSSSVNDGISFSIAFEASDIESSLELMLALDYDLLKSLELGSFLRFAHILPCIQATVRHLEITKLNLDIGRITKMSVSGFQSGNIAMAAENLEKLLLEKYGGVLADAAPSLFSVVLRPLVNKAISAYIRESDFKCDDFPFDSESTGFIDFRDLFLSPTQSKRLGGSGRDQYGDLIRTAFGIIRLELMTAHPENGIQGLSPLVGSLSFPGVLLNQGMQFNVKEMQVDVSLRLSDLRIDNLDSLGKPLSFLEPVRDEAHQLNSSATLGIGNRPVEVAGRIYMHIKGLGGLDIVNDFDLNLDVHAATVVLIILLRISEEAFVRFPLRSLLDINCWLATIPPPPLDSHGFPRAGTEPSAGVTGLGLIADKLDLKLHCHNCSSPALLELADLLSKPNSAKEMTDVANHIIDSVTRNLGGDFIQDQINRMLVEAPKHCAHSKDYDPDAAPVVYQMFSIGRTADSSTSFYAMLAVILVSLSLSAAVVLVVRRRVLKKYNNWMGNLPSERVFLMQQKQEREEQKEEELNCMTQSMYRSKDIPPFVRQIIPFIVLANIGFFLSGHLNKGGRVLINFVLAGESFQIDDFYIFSIGQSTIDMWNNGGKELAVLILLFSGVWPYTKQLITLALWFLPPSVVSCSRRGQFLLYLDLLAKWSMVDILVMLITVVGFRVRIESPNFAFIPKDFYSVDLLVVPMWGLYANMIAQLISQISSHFIIHYHRRIIRRTTALYEQQHAKKSESNMTTEDNNDDRRLLPSASQQDDPKEQLSTYAFYRRRRDGTQRLMVRRHISKVILTGSLFFCAMLIASCSITSMEVETFGIVGLMIEFGQNLREAVRYESVFSMANMLTNQAKYLGGFTNHIGLGFLAFLFVMTVMVAPILVISTLLYQWIAALRPINREKVATILEILHAWQYVEVFILAILIESWQLGTVSRLLLNHFCKNLDFTLNSLAYYGVLEKNDAQCFALEASIGAGAYMMVFIIGGLALLNTFVMKAYIQYLREKREGKEEISEDERLRAYDRTQWDNCEEAMETIRTPDVGFTDGFQWLLRSKEDDASKSENEKVEAKVVADSTYPIADASTSDEEHGGTKNLPSATKTESSTSAGTNASGTFRDNDIVVSNFHTSGDQVANSSDWSSVTSGSHLAELHHQEDDEGEEGTFTT